MQNVQQAWIKLALQDSAFFHAALSHYIGVDGLDERRGDPVKALEHRMKALSVVQDRLQSHQVATCNATIAAVASICAYESSNGTLEGVKAHWIGLENLVKMRGCFYKAGFTGSLERLVAWADLTAAFAIGSKPTIVPFDDPKPRQLTPKFDFTTYHDNIDQLLVLLRAQSRQLADGLETEAQHVEYNPGVYTSQRSILYLLDVDAPNVFSVDYCTGIAAAMYIVTCLRNIGSHSRVVQCLVGKLASAITFERSTVVPRPVAKARMLVWALFCGGVAAIRTHDRNRFARELGPLCVRLRLRSWDDVTVVLHDVTWIDSWGASHQDFWQEVAEYHS